MEGSQRWGISLNTPFFWRAPLRPGWTLSKTLSVAVLEQIWPHKWVVGSKNYVGSFPLSQRRSIEVRKGFQKRLIKKLHASTQERASGRPCVKSTAGLLDGWFTTKAPFGPRCWASLSHTPIRNSSLLSKTTLVRQENHNHHLLTLRVSAHTLPTPPALTPATATCWDVSRVGPRPSGA